MTTNKFIGNLVINSDGYNSKGTIQAALIGPNGSNIRRIQKNAGSNCFVKLYNKEQGLDQARCPARLCDSIHITADSKQAVENAAKLITKDIMALKNGSKPSKPELIVKCPKEAVGTIIGKGGQNLRSIISMVKGGSYIVYQSDRDGFVVTADTMASAELVKALIDKNIKNFQSMQKSWAKTKKDPKNTTDIRSSGSRFAILDTSDSEPEEGEADHVKMMSQKDMQSKKVLDKLDMDIKKTMDYAMRSNSGIRKRKNNTNYRNKVRYELSQTLNNNTGELKWKKMYHVPWFEVDKEINRRSTLQKVDKKEPYMSQDLSSEKEFPLVKGMSLTKNHASAPNLRKANDTWSIESVEKSSIKSAPQEVLDKVQLHAPSKALKMVKLKKRICTIPSTVNLDQFNMTLSENDMPNTKMSWGDTMYELGNC